MKEKGKCLCPKRISCYEGGDHYFGKVLGYRTIVQKVKDEDGKIINKEITVSDKELLFKDGDCPMRGKCGIKVGELRWGTPCVERLNGYIGNLIIHKGGKK